MVKAVRAHKRARRGTWEDLHLHPGTLVRMVIEGKAIIVARDARGRHVYEIYDA